MGGAMSSNVASAVSEVSNSISNTTSVNTDQLNEQTNQFISNHCLIKLSGDLNINAVTETSIKNDQITKVNSKTNFNNNIQQSVLQTALSKIGSLGIGFAEATNNTNLFCQITNDVVNSVSTYAGQFNTQTQQVFCNDSTIIAKNLNINFSNSSDFYNKQILENTNVTDITNQISQSIVQKASATVEGLAGFLIALALVIASFGYSVAKPLSSGSFKIIIVVALVVVLVGVAVWLWLVKAPPFFNDPIDCALYSNLQPKNCEECINPQMKKISIKYAPIKYLFPLSETDGEPKGIAEKCSLIGLSQVASSGQFSNNGGYTMTGYNKISDIITDLTSKLNDISKKISPSSALYECIKFNIPNLFTNPGDTKNYILIPKQFILGSSSSGDNLSGIYTPGSCFYNKNGTDIGDPDNWAKPPDNSQPYYWSNPQTTTDPTLGIANKNDYGTNSVSEWIGKCKSISKTIGLAYVRFVLTYILNQSMPTGSKLDLNVYQIQDELVYYYNTKTEKYEIDISSNPDIKDYLQNFVSISELDFQNGNSGSGTIELMMGVCNNREYKFQKFSKNIGIWILVCFIIILIGIVVLHTIKAKKKAKD